MVESANKAPRVGMRPGMALFMGGPLDGVWQSDPGREVWNVPELPQVSSFQQYKDSGPVQPKPIIQHEYRRIPVMYVGVVYAHSTVGGPEGVLARLLEAYPSPADAHKPYELEVYATVCLDPVELNVARDEVERHMRANLMTGAVEKLMERQDLVTRTEHGKGEYGRPGHAVGWTLRAVVLPISEYLTLARRAFRGPF